MRNKPKEQRNQNPKHKPKQHTNHNPNLQKSKSKNKSTNPKFMRRKERTLNWHHHHFISHHHHIHHKICMKLKKKKNTDPPLDAQYQSLKWHIKWGFKREGFGRERDYKPTTASATRTTSQRRRANDSSGKKGSRVRERERSMKLKVWNSGKFETILIWYWGLLNWFGLCVYVKLACKS